MKTVDIQEFLSLPIGTLFHVIRDCPDGVGPLSSYLGSPEEGHYTSRCLDVPHPEDRLLTTEEIMSGTEFRPGYNNSSDERIIGKIFDRPADRFLIYDDTDVGNFIDAVTSCRNLIKESEPVVTKEQQLVLERAAKLRQSSMLGNETVLAYGLAGANVEVRLAKVRLPADCNYMLSNSNADFSIRPDNKTEPKNNFLTAKDNTMTSPETTNANTHNNYLIIAHGGGCNDGFMAALLMKMYVENTYPDASCEAAFTNYGQPMPDVTGKTVFIVDFSYSPLELHEARKKAVSITMMDHHESAAKMWGGYRSFVSGPTNNLCPLTVILDENKSGAMLALDYFSYNSLSPLRDTSRLIRVSQRIDDRDRWVYQYPDTNAYREVLASIPQTFEAWKDLIFVEPDDVFEKRLEKAVIQCEKDEQICREIASKAFLIGFAGYTAPCVNAGKIFASRVGEIIGEDHPFAIVFVVTKDGILCSIRSSKTGANVEEVAKLYGGGGHVHASGFRLRHEQLPDLLAGRL